MLVLLIISYAFILLFSVGVLIRSGFKLHWLPLFWCVALYFLLNIPGSLYFLFTGDWPGYSELTYDQLSMGLILNLFFIIFWVFGYIIAIKYPFKKVPVFISPAIESLKNPAVALILFVGLSFTLVFCLQNYGYGIANSVYSLHPSARSFFGIIAFGKSLLAPLVGALLMTIHESSPSPSAKVVFFKKNLLWFLLFFSIFSSLSIAPQRGPVIAGLAIIIFVFIRNNRIKLVIALGMISFIALILANPVIDIARSEARGYGGRFAIVDAFQDYYSGTSKTSIWYKFAQKTIPPATTYALYKTVEQKTFVGLATYPSILYDIVPRIVWPGKPIPLSVNGNFSGQAARIAASFFIPDTTTSWWTVGAGTMYWQFGTVGVLLGGLLVGGIWGCFTRITISCRSVFLWLLFFMVFYYGFYLFKGLDVVLYRLVKHGFYIFIFWAGAYTIGLAGLRRHPVDNQLET